MKTCSKCKKQLSPSEFSPDKKTRDGLYAWCKPCNRTYQNSKKHEPNFEGTKICSTCEVEKPKTHFRVRRICKDGLSNECKDCQSFREIKNKYGLSKSQWLKLFNSQNNVCAICQNECSVDRPYRQLVVDHCHNTGNVRGLLCDNCNRGVGYLKDDPDRLARAIKYLEVQ